MKQTFFSPFIETDTADCKRDLKLVPPALKLIFKQPSTILPVPHCPSSDSNVEKF